MVSLMNIIQVYGNIYRHADVYHVGNSNADRGLGKTFPGPSPRTARASKYFLSGRMGLIQIVYRLPPLHSTYVYGVHILPMRPLMICAV